MTRAEIREKEQAEKQERKEKEKLEIEQLLKSNLNFDEIKILSVNEDSDYSLQVDYTFTIDGFTQKDCIWWKNSESVEQFTEKAKKYIDYIKKLRKQYPEYCKQNDFIQSNRDFKKLLELTHMGYGKTYSLQFELADYMKLPNITSCSFGGGDYEIKRTPVRVKEYNKNIDRTIEFLMDCIVELRNKKYKESIDEK